MQSSNIPTKIPLPFANAAGSGYVNTIPVTSQIGIVDGRASLADGFPPLNFDPISSGGVPPFGGDMNGILKEITSIQQWQEAGGFFPYDASFSTTIGGYPKGAILQSANGAGLWVSTAENNTTNPDTGGAGWTSLAFEGLQAITVTSSDVTVTQLQSAYPVLIVSGALTGNRNLILPAIVGEWIVQNNTTGAYTLTAKTASGTGVTLTQNASTYVYGDGTNINFADSAKVASFNGRTGTVTLTALDVTNALGYVPVQPNGTGATGTWAINISGIANTAYTAGALNSYLGGNSVLLGWDGNLQVRIDATPQGYVWANWKAAQSWGGWFGSGYQKFPNGLIVQWGFASIPTGNANPVFFSTSFPNYCTSIITSDSGTIGVPSSCYSTGHTDTYNGYFIAFMRDYNGNYVGGNLQYVAFGF